MPSASFDEANATGTETGENHILDEVHYQRDTASTPASVMKNYYFMQQLLKSSAPDMLSRQQ